MKQKIGIMLALWLGFAVLPGVADEAEAGWFGKKKKKRTEKTEEEQVPQRFDDLPSMVFRGGMLQSDAFGSWKVGETPLLVAKDCVISGGGDGNARLDAGRQITVMGPLIGGTIQAWSIYVGAPEYTTLGLESSPERREHGTNPNVGKIVDPLE